MKICPVCNESFADQLNFCDVDGIRLTREGSTQERNKWWSLLGAGLLVGALVISAASIVFLPKARVSPVVNSEPQTSPAPAKPQPAESVAAVSGAAVSAEPEGVPTDAVVPEVKRKDKALSNANVGGAPPNPKAAALAAEDTKKSPTSPDIEKSAPTALKNPDTPPAVRNPRDVKVAEPTAKPSLSSPDSRGDRQPQTPAKASEKDTVEKKKADDKDNKKSKLGNLFRAAKKVFGIGDGDKKKDQQKP